MNPSPLSIESAAQTVLHRYRFVQPGDRLTPIGNCGGFSGARLWRLEGAAGTFCLKARPVHQELLIRIHTLLQRARMAGLTIVPQVVATADGQTCVAHAGWLRDLMNWMPGRADFHLRPTVERLRAACTALAQLHDAWRPMVVWQQGDIPAIRRRRERAREWLAAVRAGWRPVFTRADDPVRPWAERAWHLLGGRIEGIEPSLAPHQTAESTPLQPCVCDLWHDHILFEGDDVTGLIDYDSAKLDHVAVDLARLLGSLVGDDAALRGAGSQAYRAARRPPVPLDEALVDVLDRTGTVLAVANWLTWLYRDGREFEDRARVAGRLAALVQRIEGWK
jgi:Ser/Thr protein kinase RdoA (MazF antagonist)